MAAGLTDDALDVVKAALAAAEAATDEDEDRAKWVDALTTLQITEPN